MSTRKLFPLILFGAILCACQAKKTESPEGFSGSGFVATLTPVVDSELAESAGKQSGLTREAVLEKLQTLGKAIRASRKDGSPGRSKSALESALWPGKNIVYNKDHSNITHVLSSPRLQCRSGSLVYALALLSSFANQAEYDAVHPVFIVEPGHVLPGFLKREKDDWHLTGIEMTASGDGIKDYGLTRSLKGSMRVSDMKAYLELFQSRDGLGKNAEARYKAEDQILAEAAKQYAVPLDALEKSIKDEYPDARDGKKLFHDFLQFAEVDVPEGDRERREVTETLPKEEIVSTRQSGGVTPWQDGPDGALTRE
ncbi:MAG: hypothetical protein EBX52_08040, partial [Proteobacteria bacterium]|nr:hypothetical protein [Pseudomonadota bacterium]